MNFRNNLVAHAGGIFDSGTYVLKLNRYLCPGWTTGGFVQRSGRSRRCRP